MGFWWDFDSYQQSHEKFQERKKIPWIFFSAMGL
jgi:hypothetical protein